MSDSPAAPAVPTATPAPAAPQQTTAEPAAAQPRRELSINEAARLLSEERRAAAGRPPRPTANGATPPAEATREAPREAARAAPQDSGDDAGEEGEGDSFYDRLNRELRGEHRPAPNGATEHGAAADDGGDPVPRSDSFTLNINGEAKRFTAAQLEEHYHKAAGFTQRMQEVAARERDLRALQAEIDRVRPVLVPEMQRQLNELGQAIPDNIDWVKLRNEDPQQYDNMLAYKLNMEQQQRNLAMLTQQQQAEEQRRRDQAIAEGHRKIAEKLPMWADPEERGRISKDLRNFASGEGLTDHEINNLTDPRYVMILLQAMSFRNNNRKVQANGGAPVLPVVQRGAPPRQARGRDSDIQQQRQRLQETHNVNDAARLLTMERQAQARNSGR